jgi:hypothetical protein
VNPDYIWTLLGLICLLVLAAMIGLGVRNAKGEDLQLGSSAALDEDAADE